MEKSEGLSKSIIVIITTTTIIMWLLLFFSEAEVCSISQASPEHVHPAARMSEGWNGGPGTPMPNHRWVKWGP